MPGLTPAQHAQLGCDYLDELLNDLESHDWCWMGALRGGAYERMAHSVSGIGFKFNEHAKALGMPLVFDGEVKKISEEQTDFWLKIVDPVKGRQSSTLTATLHQPKGANHTIRPYPFGPPQQREFRDFIERLKRELRRRAGLGPEPAADTAPPSDAAALWRKLLHHVREYQELLSQSDAWNYGREEEINKHAQALRLHPTIRRYEEHDPNAKCGTWLEVWDVWKSDSETFPIYTLAGNEIQARAGTKPHVLELLETWASKATAELEAAPMPALPQHGETMQRAQAEPALSDLDDQALPTSLPLCRIKAKAAYDWAMQSIAGAGTMTVAELHGAMMKHPRGPTDCIPDKAETFGKYLRDAGVKRYDKTGKPRLSRNVRRRGEI